MSKGDEKDKSEKWDEEDGGDKEEEGHEDDNEEERDEGDKEDKGGIGEKGLASKVDEREGRVDKGTKGTTTKGRRRKG